MANLQPLRTYIRQNIAHLRSSPCLLISSAPPPPTISTAVAGTKTLPPIIISSDSNSDSEQKLLKNQQSQREQLKFQQQQNNPKAHAFVERNSQSLTLEFNLRTVPCHISSAFPTLESVNEAVSLAKRAGLKEGGNGGNNSGDGLIIGVGSGAAMDLAKAVADSLFGNVGSCNDNDGNGENGGGGSLILAPCTLGGLWAASSNSPSILLDTKEEMLLPHLTSSWSDAICSRRVGTVVTLDPSRYLAMPPLYTPFQPVKRSEYSPAPSMAHVAAAALAIVLDVARSMDVATNAGTTIDERHVDLQKHVQNEMKAVASSCALVLELATREAKQNDDDGDNNNTKLAQQHILDAIPRLSPLVEQSSLLAQNNMSMTTTTGTIPQKLANALLPSYFPQCHLVTYLACILPGLCDVVSSTSASSEGEMSMVEAVANSMINNGNANDQVQVSSLSSWASQVTLEAGVPSMASLAYGTPDFNTLVGSLDSYESLMASLNRDVAGGRSGRDEQWVMEDVLRQSLIR